MRNRSGFFDICVSAVVEMLDVAASFKNPNHLNFNNDIRKKSKNYHITKCYEIKW
jgi:hypothetical protein